ncbi:unnamed protein product, partial [Amoebophrya sp. A25]
SASEIPAPPEPGGQDESMQQSFDDSRGSLLSPNTETRQSRRLAEIRTKKAEIRRKQEEQLRLKDEMDPIE